MFFRDFLVLFGQGVAIIGVVCAEPGAWAGDTSNCSDFWEKLFLIKFLEAFSYREREVLKEVRNPLTAQHISYACSNVIFSRPSSSIHYELNGIRAEEFSEKGTALR